MTSPESLLSVDAEIVQLRKKISDEATVRARLQEINSLLGIAVVTAANASTIKK